MRTLPVYAVGLTFQTPRRRGNHLPRGVLPAEFGEAVVVDAEVVGDLVHDRPADLVGDLFLGTGRLDVDHQSQGYGQRAAGGVFDAIDALRIANLAVPVRPGWTPPP